MPRGSFGVVDLFAGPGGLSEGFASVRTKAGRAPFSVCLSVEKDPVAHETLRLRKFLRSFETFPQEYYEFLNGRADEPEWKFLHPARWRKADSEALKLTLGEPEATSIIDERIDAIRRRFGNRTVLLGGPPCQAYSIVGRSRNAGIAGYVPGADSRHFLYEEYVRVLGKLKPAAFVMENVKGILSSSPLGSRIFCTVLRDLQSAGGASGYTLFAVSKVPRNLQDEFWSEPEDFIVRSEQFGVPQSRHRVIIVGIRQDIAEAAERKHGPAGVRDLLHLRQSSTSATVSSVLRGMPRLRSGLSGGLDTRERWHDSLESGIRIALSSICNAKGKGVGQLRALLEKRLATLARSAANPRRSGVPYGLPKSCSSSLRDWIEDRKLSVLPQHEARSHMEGDLGRYIFASSFAHVHGRSPVAHEFPAALAPRHRNWASGKFADRFRVQVWNRPATTVTSHISKDGHYYIHPDPAQCRSLTVREAARLQTFPDNYYFKGNRTQQYTQVGNAVPPYLAYQIARALWSVLDVDTEAKMTGRAGTRRCEARSTA